MERVRGCATLMGASEVTHSFGQTVSMYLNLGIEC